MVEFKFYKVKPRFANLIIEHDDLQGDVYWTIVIILFWRGFKLNYWGNTSGRYTIPKFSFRFFR